MSIPPNDPRHGSYAGALQHWRAGEKACDDCLRGARRAAKLRDLARLQGRPPMVPLGEHLHHVIATTPRNQVTAATGISSHRLVELERRGPDHLVRRATRERLLAFRPRWTPIGIQRRLQALAVLGWSMKAISTYTGVHLSSLSRLRRNADLKFVRRTIAESVLDAWDALSEMDAPDSPSSIETRAEAIRRGWWPPMAWDNIDDSSEDPAAPAADLIDEVAVLRILAGDWRHPATRAERIEVVARWRDAGRPLKELGRLTGWKVERYYTPGTRQEVA